MLAAGEGRRIVWDSEIGGFGVRLTKAGAHAFLDYRDLTRAKRRCSIGRVPAEMTIERARQRAAAIRVDVRSGRDPVTERKAATEAANRVEVGLRVAEAIENWIERRAPDWSEATRAEYERCLRKDLIPQIGRLLLTDLNRQIIMAQISRVEARSEAAAAGLFRVVGSFIRHCDDRGLLVGITLPNAKSVSKPLKPRTRMPDDGRIFEIWHAAERLRPRSRALARTIILTAQRRRTVEGTDWGELDLEGGSWIIPGSRMKNGEPHQVALGPLAVAELQALRRVPGRPYVFSDTNAPPCRLNRILKTMQSSAGDGWSWHDFRRAFMTWAVSHGHPREYAKIALGHLVKDRLDQAYDQHSYAPEAGRVMLAWQGHVGRLITGRSVDNVIAMKR
jgi:integrase